MNISAHPFSDQTANRAQQWCKALLALAVVGLCSVAHADALAPQKSGSDVNPQTLPGTPLLIAQASAKAGASAQAQLDALVKAARAEGEMTYYTSVPENVAKRVSAAFTAKYAIKTQFIRLASVPVMQRFASEAEAGNFAADVVMVTGAAIPFAEDGIRKGSIESLAEAGLPVLTSGEFPAKFNRTTTAIISLAPFLLYYNTDKVKGADIPKDWPDLLNPKWKGQILLIEPVSSDTYIDFWAALFDRHGESFFQQLRAQNPRFFAAAFPNVQALAAGEGSIGLPTIMSLVHGAKEKGAPIDVLVPDYTTGSEMFVVLASRTKAKRPNAGRLFVNYVMSPEGNKVFNDDPGGASVYDTRSLPKDYVASKPGTAAARKQQVMNLFGIK